MRSKRDHIPFFFLSFSLSRRSLLILLNLPKAAFPTSRACARKSNKTKIPRDLLHLRALPDIEITLSDIDIESATSRLSTNFAWWISRYSQPRGPRFKVYTKNFTDHIFFRLKILFGCLYFDLILLFLIKRGMRILFQSIERFKTSVKA